MEKYSFQKHLDFVGERFKEYGGNEDGTGVHPTLLQTLHRGFLEYASQEPHQIRDSIDKVSRKYLEIMNGPLKEYQTKTHIEDILEFLKTRGSLNETETKFVVEFGDENSQRTIMNNLLDKGDKGSVGSHYAISQKFERFLQFMDWLPTDSSLNSELLQMLGEAPILEDNFLSKVGKMRMGDNVYIDILKRFESEKETEFFGHLMYAFTTSEVGFNGSSTFFPRLLSSGVVDDISGLVKDTIKRRGESCYSAILNTINVLDHGVENINKGSGNRKSVKNYEILISKEKAEKLAIQFFDHLLSKRNKKINPEQMSAMLSLVKIIKEQNYEIPDFDKKFNEYFDKLTSVVFDTANISEFFAAVGYSTYPVGLGQYCQLTNYIENDKKNEIAHKFGESFHIISKMYENSPNHHCNRSNLLTSIFDSVEKFGVKKEQIVGEILPELLNNFELFHNSFWNSSGESFFDLSKMMIENSSNKLENAKFFVNSLFDSAISGELDAPSVLDGIIKNKLFYFSVLSDPNFKEKLSIAGALTFVDSEETFVYGMPKNETVVKVLAILEKFGFKDLSARYETCFEESKSGKPILPLDLFFDAAFGAQKTSALLSSFVDGELEFSSNPENRKLFVDFVTDSLARSDRKDELYEEVDVSQLFSADDDGFSV